jgi:hypothetical protein
MSGTIVAFAPAFMASSRVGAAVAMAFNRREEVHAQTGEAQPPACRRSRDARGETSTGILCARWQRARHGGAAPRTPHRRRKRIAHARGGAASGVCAAASHRKEQRVQTMMEHADDGESAKKAPARAQHARRAAAARSRSGGVMPRAAGDTGERGRRGVCGLLRSVSSRLLAGARKGTLTAWREQAFWQAYVAVPCCAAGGHQPRGRRHTARAPPSALCRPRRPSLLHPGRRRPLSSRHVSLVAAAA